LLKILLMTLRLLWLVSLVSGVLFYLHVAALPLQIHMYLGFAIAAIMIAIGVLGMRVAAGLALLTIVWAIALPVIGIMQLAHPIMSSLLLTQIVHVVLGIGAIALAEVLGKRIRIASTV
jgi:hypothetical protein